MGRSLCRTGPLRSNHCLNLPKSADQIGIQSCVTADDRNRFDQGLGCQHSVERVFVMKRQRNEHRCVTNLNEDNPEIVLFDPSSPERFKRHTERVPAQAYFDRNFPSSQG